MTNEYASKLISQLYVAADEHKAYDILREIDEILSDVFLYPLFDTYKKFKGGIWSHTFISSIGRIDSPDSLEIIKEIAGDEKIGHSDFVGCLEAFEKFSYFEEPYLSKAESILMVAFTTEKINFFLPDLLSYLEKAKRLASQEHILKLLFESDKLDKDERRQALNAYLKLHPKENIAAFTENYSELKNKDTEIILVKELLTWRGTAVDAFIAKVRSDGSPSARHLVEQKDKAKAKAKEHESLKAVEDYSNGKEVTEIGAARRKINELSKSTTGIETEFFPEDETIFTQVSTVKTRDELVSKCSSLRELVQNISKGARNHGLDLEGATKILSTATADNLNKSLTAFQLFLLNKKVDVSSDLFGMRELMAITSLLGAHQEAPELLPALKKAKLLEMYHSDQWGPLHKEILSRYKTVLENIVLTLEKFRKG